MQVAVIDDGVNVLYYPNIGDLSFDLTITDENKVIERKEYYSAKSSHGSTCASIIKKYAPMAKIGSIKILSDSTQNCKVNKLITALDWCLKNNIKLIHMSIGSRSLNDLSLMWSSIFEACTKDIVIVAALANTMKFSIPACFIEVFGVRTNLIFNEDQYVCDDGGIYSVPFVASSLHTLVNLHGKIETTQVCNSFAAPVITAKITNILKSNSMLSCKKIREKLGAMVKSHESYLENYCYRLSKTPFFPNTIDIPVISFVGESLYVLDCINRLSKFFLINGYSCMGFADFRQKPFIHIIGLTDTIPLIKQLAFHKEKLDLNIILITNEESQKSNFLTDMEICLSSITQENIYTTEYVVIPNSPTDNDLRALMNYIIKQGS